jgi:4,5-dihydroxyphthalate decarboxylase
VSAEVTFASGSSPVLDPILAGTVRPDGIALAPVRLHPAELFRRQFDRAEFDVSELSLASLLMRWSSGDRTWRPLPVLPRRDFFHTYVRVREGGRVRTPADLNGSRIGVPEYQMSAATWSRGTLADEFGFDPFTASWSVERLPHQSIGAVSAARVPDGIDVQHVPAGDSMRAMLARGDLDAVLLFVDELHPAQASPADRSGQERADGVASLFADDAAEGRRYLRSSGVLPANHCMVVRAALAERDPSLPSRLTEMFERARVLANGEARSQLRLAWQTGDLPWGAVADFAFPPYDREDAVRTVQKLADHLYAQRLIDRPVDSTELFPAD